MPIPSKTDPKGKPAVPPKGFIDWAGHGAGAGRSNGDDERPQWRPSKVGDQITGTLVRADRVNTKFGERTVLEFDGARSIIAEGVEFDGAQWVAWPTAGMIEALADVEARIGGTYKVELVELLDTGKGNPYRIYAVETAEPSF